MTYLFTVCEYGRGEIGWCIVTCEQGFADGFELALTTHLDAELHYVVREQIGEEDIAGQTATVGPWIQAA